MKEIQYPREDTKSKYANKSEVNWNASGRCARSANTVGMCKKVKEETSSGRWLWRLLEVVLAPKKKWLLYDPRKP